MLLHMVVKELTQSKMSEVEGFLYNNNKTSNLLTSSFPSVQTKKEKSLSLRSRRPVTLPSLIRLTVLEKIYKIIGLNDILVS